MFELALLLGVSIIIIAFVAEYLDSTTGMGYGTALTPLLLAIGFNPLQIVPPLLVSQLVAGFLAGFFHHKMGNANFKPQLNGMTSLVKQLKDIGYAESFRQNIPDNLKVTLIISACGILGAVSAVFVATHITTVHLKMYIGFVVLAIGFFILATLNKKFKFSWGKITILSMIASFNKGISAGGYGPLITSGQLISGVNERNAISITTLSEAITCVAGVLMYLVSRDFIDWTLLPYLLIGTVMSTPLSAYTVKKITTKRLRVVVGVLTIILGSYTLIEVMM
ncbi:MAG: sulfite exporter TauE/SafE family protein [Candidatus Altiarchaeota archaeon]